MECGLVFRVIISVYGNNILVFFLDECKVID